MSVDMLTTLRAQRDHHARLCADLLNRGYSHDARRHAVESERYAEQIRALIPTGGAS